MKKKIGYGWTDKLVARRTQRTTVQVRPTMTAWRRAFEKMRVALIEAGLSPQQADGKLRELRLMGMTVEAMKQAVAKITAKKAS